MYVWNFNPHAPGGGDQTGGNGGTGDCVFQSTRPGWGATLFHHHSARAFDISIHTPRVGRDFCYLLGATGTDPISIHTPRVARREKLSLNCLTSISIHTPRVGRDAAMAAEAYQVTCISIHTPRVGRDNLKLITTTLDIISIHTPRVGRRGTAAPAAGAKAFQSTRPGWGATGHRPRAPGRRDSIHTPRVGRDVRRQHRCACSHNYFNPHAPGGARRARTIKMPPEGGISIHTPGWGATNPRSIIAKLHDISIHTPRVGRDVSNIDPCVEPKGYFNPHAPGGARPSVSNRMKNRVSISIHTPRVGRDRSIMCHWRISRNYFNPHAPGGARLIVLMDVLRFEVISIHTPRVGRDVLVSLLAIRMRQFQSTRPGWGAT